MSRSKTITLKEAMEAAQTLPEEARPALAEEVVALVEDDHAPGLTDTQREFVKKRLAEPSKHVAREDFLEMLRRYNPTL